LQHLPSSTVPISEYAGRKMDQAYIGNSTNGRIEDLRITAKILLTCNFDFCILQIRSGQVLIFDVSRHFTLGQAEGIGKDV
jgi:hypothetical protein